MNNEDCGKKLTEQYGCVLARWIELDNQAKNWRVVCFGAACYIDNYQINTVPTKSVYLLIFGCEVELARQLNALSAMAQLTFYSTKFPLNAAHGLRQGVTPRDLKRITRRH